LEFLAFRIKGLIVGSAVAFLAGCQGLQTVSLPSQASSAFVSADRNSGYKMTFSFKGSDGADPYSSLVAVNGSLYGTTVHGGGSNNGTVFEITPSGNQKVLYSFKGTPDGSEPEGGLQG
jgi:uncharacterized repeat protein (TIGR03803 family)